MRLIASIAEGQLFQEKTRSLWCAGRQLSELENPALKVLRIVLFLLIVSLFQGHAIGRTHWLHFVATAYSVSGETASQTITEEGRTLAADPSVLPIGTVVEVRDAGPYSGQYVVQDTGEKIVGHKIDIYIAKTGEALQFGKRNVRVRVLRTAPPTPREQRRAAAEATVLPKPPKSQRVDEYYSYRTDSGPVAMNVQ
jgi:3D (Asp-Asp-Asp) domain-containing protein